MSTFRRTLSSISLTGSLVALFLVAALTLALLGIGQERVGAGVIPLLYLLPIGWCTSRWGQGVGIIASIAAAAAFDFFFIPPFFTFTIGSLEGWLVFGIFLLVAIVIVGRIQSGLTQARYREKEAIFMYELISALAGQFTPEKVARVLAEHLQQLYLARQVEVSTVASDGMDPVTIRIPSGTPETTRPDLVIPLLATQSVEGEISVWRGGLPIPDRDSRLISTYSTQGAYALERIRLLKHQSKI